jgi:hypothetical protein
MIHKKLSTKPEQNYGISINCDKTHVLFQLTDGFEQARVCFTSQEVDQIIESLNLYKSKLIDEKK